MMTNASPFHEGEQRVQLRLGVRDEIEPWARQVVRDYLPEEHRIFHESLPFLVAAARDREGRPWATLLAGPPGFVRSPHARRLTIAALPVPGDALEGALTPGADLGLLGIGLESRRRNRVNGRIGRGGANGIQFDVNQAFGNCPQYIHERAWKRVPEPAHRLPARRATRLSPALREWIGAADTFFIASGHRGREDKMSYGMDASHRGGEPGFVQVVSDTHLVFPDYSGNNHYNTIGNLIMDPRAGLLFVDFERGSLLQLSGRTSIDWDSPAVSRFPGARRLVSFMLDEVVELAEALPLRWSVGAESVRTLRLVDKIHESNDVTSFVFEARDGSPLAEFEAGQHLPIQLEIPDLKEPVRRTYSLSNGPGERHYRISVKRESNGVASRYLHDRIERGACIEAHGPAGEFVLSNGNRPIVLISAGIGLTPMVSMLHALTRAPMHNDVWFIHGARDGDHHPLSGEVRSLVAHLEHVHVHVTYSRPGHRDVPGIDFDSTGRVDGDLIARLVPELDAEFYLCGPRRFMADIQSALIARAVLENRIHAESFGPVG